MNEPPLPLFGSGFDPGPSFAELLRRTAPPDAGAAQAAGVQPASVDVPHGTTVVAIRFADGVVLAGDRRATSGYAIANRRIEKVFPADDLSGVAIAGVAGPGTDMVRLFQTQLEHYEKIEGEPLSLEGKANQLAQMVRANLPAAMQGLIVVPLFAVVEQCESKAGIGLVLARKAGGLLDELQSAFASAAEACHIGDPADRQRQRRHDVARQLAAARAEKEASAHAS